MVQDGDFSTRPTNHTQYTGKSLYGQANGTGWWVHHSGERVLTAVLA